MAVGEVTGRELVLALAVSYWCEGTKSKPWNPQERVKWMNSDPRLVLLFLEGLEQLGVHRDRLRFRLQIHESADEQGAREWWGHVVGLPPEGFQRSTLKRHNPKPSRHNRDDGYHGCLVICVLQSRPLYQYIEGLVSALAAACQKHDVAG